MKTRLAAAAFALVALGTTGCASATVDPSSLGTWIEDIETQWPDGWQDRLVSSGSAIVEAPHAAAGSVADFAEPVTIAEAYAACTGVGESAELTWSVDGKTIEEQTHTVTCTGEYQLLDAFTPPKEGIWATSLEFSATDTPVAVSVVFLAP